MKKNIKIVLTLLTFVSLTAFSPLLRADDRPISFEKLPETAQKFVKEHFSSPVSLATVDKEFFGKTYEVILADGTRIEFDKKGVWKDVEVMQDAVPDRIIPAPIAKHVVQNFPGTVIKQIEKRKRGGYQVELSNGLELKFDAKLRFTRMDD